MQLIKQSLIILILSLFIPNIAIANSRSVKPALTCDQVLKSCAKTVESQKEAIDKQKKVIEAQDKKIEIMEDRVEELDEEVDIHRGMNIGSILLIILLIL